jgi:general secretion pathway protein N
VAERNVLQRFDQAGPLTWLLAASAGWAVLLWIAALLGMGGQVGEAVPAAAEVALPQAKPAAPDRMGPLAQYAEAASRPLFTQDRRPRSFMATAPDGDNVATSQSLDFILTGVLISPQVQLAVLQPTGGGDAQRVRVGNSPEGGAGWRLVEVQPRRAIFEGAGGQSALDLRTFGEAGGPAATSVARPQPTPAVATAAPPPGPQAAADGPQDEEARIEAIRKRIEARRAQLRAGQTGSSTSSSSSTQPPKP